MVGAWVTKEGIAVALPGSRCRAEILLYTFSGGAARCFAHYPTSMCLLRCVSPSLHQGLEAGSVTAIHMSCIPPTNWYTEEINLTNYLNPLNSCTPTTHITIYNVMNRVPRKQQQSLIMKPKDVSSPGTGRQFILRV